MSEELAHILNTVGEKRSKLNPSVWLQGQTHTHTSFLCVRRVLVEWDPRIQILSEVKHDYMHYI